jgi:hypothetical protein
VRVLLGAEAEVMENNLAGLDAEVMENNLRTWCRSDEKQFSFQNLVSK